MLNDKYVGVLLALSSGVFIGTSFIITKLGLMEAQSKRGGRAGEGYNYLVNFKWWLGMVTMVLGELANFAAYTYAPAILVTPLGAVSVFVSAVLASLFLNEKLGFDGKVGCVLCVIGSVIIILHAPEDPEVTTVDAFLSYAMNFWFLVYSLLVSGLSLFLIYKVAPLYGKENMLVYITICSLVGSISVMACKGFGIALRLSFEGSNQFKYFSTYFFGFIVLVCAVTQMNYLNKALDLFSTNRVTPVYYVFFSTATIIASVLLFQGFNDTSGRDVISVLCGFLTIFIGVILVNSQRVSSQTSPEELEGYQLQNQTRKSQRSRKGGHMRVRSSSRDPGFDGDDIVIDDLTDGFDDGFEDAVGSTHHHQMGSKRHITKSDSIQEELNSHSPAGRLQNDLDLQDDVGYNFHDYSFSSGLPSPHGISSGEVHMMKTFDEEVLPVRH